MMLRRPPELRAVEAVWVALAVALGWDGAKQQLNWPILGWLTLAQAIDLVLDGFLEKFLVTWKAWWHAAQ